MERFAVLFGVNDREQYIQLAGDSGVTDYLVRCGADNAAYTLDVVSARLRGFYALDGYGLQPLRCRPVTVRYAPVCLSRKEDMPDGMRPLYACSVNGKDLQGSKKADYYDYLVLMDREELLSAGKFSYLDHIFGTWLLSTGDLDRIRRRRKLDCGALPRKVDPVVYPADRDAVFAAVESIFAGRTVVIRLERGMVFNTRAVELLSQIYSLLPARLAIETGFASYQDPIRIRRITEDTGIRVFVVPGEVSLDFLDVEADILDLNEPESICPGDSLLVKCLRKWSTLSWKERYEAMTALFANVGAGIRDVQVFAKITSAFFGDPFFHYKPAAGSCSSLEELKEAFDPFQVLKYDIGWVRDRMRAAAAAMLTTDSSLPRMKAEAAAKARAASTPEERKKYTALYRLAQKLDPSDASLHAIVATEQALQNRFREETDVLLARQNREWNERAEQWEQEMRRDMQQQIEQARGEQQEVWETKLAQAQLRQESLIRDTEARLAEEKAAHETYVAIQEKRVKDIRAMAERQLREAQIQAEKEKKQLSREQEAAINKLEQEHAARIRKMTEERNAAVQKARASQTSNLQVENLQKRIRELDAAHQAELEKQKKAYEAELSQLRKQQEQAANAGTAGREQSGLAKQIVAEQMMRNLAYLEHMEAQHRAALAAAGGNNNS